MSRQEFGSYTCVEEEWELQVVNARGDEDAAAAANCHELAMFKLPALEKGKQECPRITWWPRGLATSGPRRLIAESSSRSFRQWIECDYDATIDAS